MKQLAIQAHIDNGFCATFSQKKIGGVLEIPENELLKKDARQYLYEVDDNVLNIYLHGLKHKSHTLPPYSIRPFILMDIITAMSNMGMSPFLLRVFDDSKKEITETESPMTTRRAVDLLSKPTSRKQQNLEKALFDGLEHFIFEGCVEKITEDIEEGFEIIASHYLTEAHE